MFASLAAGIKRHLARRLLEPLLSVRFMQRRALAILNRHFTAGELTLRYRLKDHTLYLDPADDVITTNVLLKGDWQRENIDRAIEILKREAPQMQGGVFIDVGANVGTQTIYAMLSGHFSSALAIEPDPANFDLLQKNIAVNNLAGRVKLENCAAGSAPQSLPLQRHGTNRGAHAFDLSGHDSVGAIPVPIRRLMDILADASIAAKEVGLIWIDVEGFEFNVLNGMPNLLNEQVPLVIEHDPARIGKGRARAIYGLLAEHHDRVCRIDESDRPAISINQMNATRDSGDFLFFSTRWQQRQAAKSSDAEPHRRTIAGSALGAELLHP